MRPQLDRDVLARVQDVLRARTADGPLAKSRPAHQAPVLDLAGDGPAELLIMDEIGFFGIMAGDVADFVNRARGRDLHVRISSPGGDVFDAIAIFNMIAAHPGRVTVAIEGLAASAASVIAMAGDHIEMPAASQLMIHDVWTMAVGNAADMREYADLLDRLSDMIAGVYAARAGGDADAWREVMQGEAWYTAEEAIEAGLVDAMAPPRKRPGDDDPGQDMAARFDLRFFRFAGRHEAPPPPPKPVPAAPPEPGAPVLNTAVGPHDTAVEDGEWDAGANEKRLPSPMSLATARKFYADYDGDAVEDGKIPKSAGHLPHHFVSEDGTPGAASVNGVRNALARLGQTQGLSEEERATVERHLNGHLNRYKREHGDDDTGSNDAWAEQIAHLTHTDSEGADDEFARLMEAL